MNRKTWISANFASFFQWVMLGKGHGGLYNASTKEERRKRKAKRRERYDQTQGYFVILKKGNKTNSKTLPVPELLNRSHSRNKSKSHLSNVNSVYMSCAKHKYIKHRSYCYYSLACKFASSKCFLQYILQR